MLNPYTILKSCNFDITDDLNKSGEGVNYSDISVP